MYALQYALLFMSSITDDAPSVPQAVVTSHTPEQDQEELYDDANVVGGGGGGGGGDTDVRARALYDYQAGEFHTETWNILQFVLFKVKFV